MKKRKRRAPLTLMVLFAGIFLSTGTLTAQEAQKAPGDPPAAEAQPVDLYEYESSHYKVLSALNQEHAQNVAAQMEALFAAYNEWFHFEPSHLETPLRVRILADKSGFDAHLSRIIDSPREDFVYLHYTRADRCELIGFAPAADEGREDFDKSLAHQGFIQFIKAYVDHPPLWMREGFAVFFETAQWNTAQEQLIFQENLQWLPPLKKLLASYGKQGLIPLRELLTSDEEAMTMQSELFIPQSWALVSFLTQTDNRRYNRVLWDSIAVLQPEMGLNTNSAMVADKAFNWVDEETLTTEYFSYINARKSYRELVEGGILQYTKKNYAEAAAAFQKALAMDDNFYVPYYYLGLLAYATDNYEQADYYYETARQAGGPAPLIDYAQGVNAYAAERIDSAEAYLTKAKEGDPETYGTKTQEILTRIDLYY